MRNESGHQQNSGDGDRKADIGEIEKMKTGARCLGQCIADKQIGRRSDQRDETAEKRRKGDSA